MKLTPKQLRGDYGERAARRYLRRHGYRIRAVNYAACGHELDIVAETREYLAFVEVKTRRLDPALETTLTKPAAAVDREKQRHILSAARAYLGAFSNNGRRIRFDIIEVYLDPASKRNRVLRIHHIISAFTA